MDVLLDDGRVVSEELAVADAHPNGRRPWRWPDYVGKLEALTEGRLPADAREEFLDRARRLGELAPREVRRLNPALPPGTLRSDRAVGDGIF